MELINVKRIHIQNVNHNIDYLDIWNFVDYNPPNYWEKVWKAKTSFVINASKCKGCTLCVKACPQEAITGVKTQPHVIDQSKCNKCGACVSRCRFSAIEKVYD